MWVLNLHDTLGVCVGRGDYVALNLPTDACPNGLAV